MIINMHFYIEWIQIIKEIYQKYSTTDDVAVSIGAPGLINERAAPGPYAF